jgi:hypothetical protein
MPCHGWYAAAHGVFRKEAGRGVVEEPPGGAAGAPVPFPRPRPRRRLRLEPLDPPWFGPADVGAGGGAGCDEDPSVEDGTRLLWATMACCAASLSCCVA